MTVEALSKQIRRALRQSGSVEIDGLGVFEKDEAGNISFHHSFQHSRKARIFISYAKEDAASAERLFAELTSRGFAAWLDNHKLLPGQNWQQRIEDAIASADFFIACFSTQSVRKRGGFQVEIRHKIENCNSLCSLGLYFDFVYEQFVQSPFGSLMARGVLNETLVLYKRHRGRCEVHKKRLSSDAKKYFWDCTCPIWITGTIPGTDIVVDRQSTGERDIRKAEAVRDAKIAEHTAQVASDSITGPSLQSCVAEYLASRESEIVGRTYAGIERALDKLAMFCRASGAIYMRDLTVDLLERFKLEGFGPVADTSRVEMFKRVLGFLRDAYRRSWISEPLAEKVRRPTAEQGKMSQPFTDKELDCIMRNAEQLVDYNPSSGRFAANPKTFRLLLELMLATGMRVGDAIRFDPATLTRGETIWIYNYVPQKQRIAKRRKHAEAYISDALKRQIDESVWMTPEVWPFYYGAVNESVRVHVANSVYKLMRAVGKRCGVEHCRPHRLRDTFAVRCLTAKPPMKLEEVSRLLNHSSVVVTERHYAAWTRGRKVQLERAFTRAILNPGRNGSRKRKPSANNLLSMSDMPGAHPSASRVWHKLSTEFMRLAVSDFRADWQLSYGGKDSGSYRYTLKPHSRSLRLQFERAARKAGNALETGRQGDPLQAWLDSVRLRNPGRDSGPRIGPEVIDGQEFWHQLGEIPRLCQASAERCLELEAEADKLERVGPVLNDVQPSK
jgi:integrase